MFDRAMDLTNGALGVTSGLDLPRGSQWPSVVTVFLTQANERLDSIRVLLDRNYWASGVILTRSLFERAVNLAYLAKDVEVRLPDYLQHGGIPTTTEEAVAIREEIEKNDRPEVAEVVPRYVWKPLRYMCADLGPDWLKEYETFYPYASVPTHAGSFTLGTTYTQLLEQRPPSDRVKAVAMLTALAFHLRIAEIAGSVFPDAINPEAINDLRRECQELGQTLNQG